MEDFVVCEICGKKASVINHLHLRVHNITVDEYVKKYPDAKLTSDKTVENRNRKLKGQKRSEATKKKLSIANKISWSKNPNQGRTGSPLSDESRKNLSKKLQGHFVSEETKKKIGISGEGREPWNKGLTKDDDDRLKDMSRKISVWNSEFMTDEKKNKISETLKRKYAEGMKLPQSKGGYREDLDMYFRSRWEANYARILKNDGKEIVYEVDRFVLKNENGEIFSTYITDFKLDDKKYIEIKGHANSKDNWSCSCKRCKRDKKKLKMLYEQYPGVEVKILGKKEYKELCRKYEHSILNWENNNSTRKFRRKNMKDFRVSIYLFGKPVMYFKDCSKIDLKEIVQVREILNSQLDFAYDQANIFVKNGWDYEFNWDELVFSKDDMRYENEEEIKKELIEAGVDIDRIMIDEIY